MTPFDVNEASGPILLGQPHGGTSVPESLFDRLNARGQVLADTDWHISRLYDGLLDEVSVVKARFHRYVIDANRDPEGASLYPGQNTTGLCPEIDFDGQGIWREGQAPSADDILARRDEFHAPYHAALADQMARIKARHGVVILLDCHSIRSFVPFLFDGRLPVFSIGTNLGLTCAPEIEAATEAVCHKAAGFDHVLNGRFKGGWTTRHYGRPQMGEHAIQMELAQRAYMDEAVPWSYRPDRADLLRLHLGNILKNLTDLALSGALTEEGTPHV